MIGIGMGISLGASSGGGVVEPPQTSGVTIASMADLINFGLTGGALPSTPASAFGDSITFGGAPANMKASGTPFSGWINLGYTPFNGMIQFGAWPQEADILLASTFGNMGAPGETAAQIRARIVADTLRRTQILTWSAGTNGYSDTMATFLALIADINAGIAVGDAAKWIIMPYDVDGGATFTSWGYGQLQHARSVGAKDLDWHTASLKVAHRINTDGFPGAKAAWIARTQLTAMMSQNTPAGGLDTTHPGPVFTEAVAKDVARVVSAVSGLGPPFLHMQSVPVDWSVPAGTKIKDLKIIGTPTTGSINNDGGFPDAVYYQNGALYRGAGAAPSAPWISMFVEVGNAAGFQANRVMLGRATGTTRLKAAAGRIMGVNTVDFASGTISLVFRPEDNQTSEFGNFGPMGLKVRGTGTIWFQHPAFSSNLITANTAINTWSHVMLSWSPDACYTRVNGVEVNRQPLVTSALNCLGRFQLCGDTNNLVKDILDLEHFWFSPEYIPPGSNISALVTAGHRSAITPTSYKFSAVEPAIAIAGGPGRFGSGENWGSLGRLDVFPEWDHVDAQIT